MCEQLISGRTHQRAAAKKARAVERMVIVVVANHRPPKPNMSLLDHVASLVIDEEKIISCSWLAREHHVSVLDAQK